MEITSIPISELLMYFWIYLISHIVLGYAKSNLNRDLKKNPDDKKLIKNVKVVTYIFKWFPAMWVIFIIVALLIN